MSNDSSKKRCKDCGYYLNYIHSKPEAWGYCVEKSRMTPKWTGCDKYKNNDARYGGD